MERVAQLGVLLADRRDFLLQIRERRQHVVV
jgi:hypothetical protein